VTDDKVETIGIERTRRAIEESDLVLVMVDLTAGWGEEEEEVLKLLDGPPYMLVLNKIDQLKEEATPHEIDNCKTSSLCVGRARISAITGAGLSELKEKLERFAISDNALVESGGSLNQRQAELCLLAISALDDLVVAVKNDLPQDCLVTDLKTAIQSLSEACGDDLSEEIITEVFRRFCIGK
jgi:tRNA modification GTPase